MKELGIAVKHSTLPEAWLASEVTDLWGIAGEALEQKSLGGHAGIAWPPGLNYADPMYIAERGKIELSVIITSYF